MTTTTTTTTALFTSLPTEVLRVVFVNLWDLNDVRELSLTCKELRLCALEIKHILHDLHMSPLIYLINKYPDKPWDWHGLSENSEINFKFVMKHKDKPWDWNSLSRNRGITVDDILANPDLPWNWGQPMSYTKRAGIDTLVRTFPDKGWEWRCLSGSVSLDFIREFPDLPWAWCIISEREDLEVDFVLEFAEKKWSRAWLSKNRNMTLDFILSHPELPWDYDWVSLNTSITLKQVFDNPTLPWSWYSLSENSSIFSIENYRRYPKLPWHWTAITNGIPFNVMEEHPDLPWDNAELGNSDYCILTYDKAMRAGGGEMEFSYLSRYLNNPQSIIDHPDAPWQWSLLSRNPCVTWDLVQQLPNCPWSWKDLSKNPSIGYNIVIRNLGKPWDWKLLSYDKKNERYRVHDSEPCPEDEPYLQEEYEKYCEYYESTRNERLYNVDIELDEFDMG